MKAAPLVLSLLSLLMLVVLVHESEAGLLKTLWSLTRQTVKDEVTALKGAVRLGVETVKHVGNPPDVRLLKRDSRTGRQKRSALTMNNLDDVNAADIATTFNLDLPVVQKVFTGCDVDKNGILDGKEIITFVGRVEGIAGRRPTGNVTKKS